MLRLALTALVLAGCVPLGSNGQDAAPAGCPAIGCGPSYQIDFKRAGPWPAGTYRVEVVAEGLRHTCDVIFPLSCDRPPRCQGNPEWLPIVSGCALDPAQQRIEGVVFNTFGPLGVTVKVSVDDRPLGMGTFTPTYNSVTLAPGCSLTCFQAPRDAIELGQ
jgi:hypothetical protein